MKIGKVVINPDGTYEATANNDERDPKLSGEVFITADEREISDPRKLELYTEALAAVVPAGPKFIIHPEAVVPELPEERKPPEKVRKKVVVKEKPPEFRYPVNISPVGEKPLKFDLAPAPDGTEISTLRQRFYLWQKQDEKGGLLELQADNAVIFYSTKQLEEDE